MGKNIDGITRTASALTGTERFALRDGVADPDGDLDAKGVISQIATYMASGVLDTYINNLIATDRTTQRRGTIQLWGADAAPTGALLCNGQAVSRFTYAALFAIIGTTFGVGDNSTTFKVPNFQGVVPKGVGSQTINTRSKSGPLLGKLQEDQGQLIEGSFRLRRGPSSSFILSDATGALTDLGGIGSLKQIITYTASTEELTQHVSFSSANSPDARTGAETRENCLGINFIIWY